METAKDTFYRRLRQDYRLWGADSVIYRFIQEEQERLYQQYRNGSSAKKGSSLIHLRLRYDALTAGEETPLEYIADLLHILSSRPVLYQDSTENTCLELLSALAAVGLGKADEPSLCISKRRLQESLAELAQSFDQESPEVRRRYMESQYVQRPCLALDRLTRALFANAVHVEVKAFFYDVGYSLNPKSYGEIDRAAQTKRGRKPRVDKTLSLLDAYCASNRLSLFHSGLNASLEECRKLFSLLSRGENRDVLVPLYVDSRSGCALYIVGKNLYARFYEQCGSTDRLRKYRQDGNACAYGILRFTGENLSGDFVFGYTLSDWFDEYVSLEEAIAQYEDECSSVLVEISESYNGTLPPGSPEVFRIYSRPVLSEVTPMEIEAAREEEQAEYAAYLASL